MTRKSKSPATSPRVRLVGKEDCTATAAASLNAAAGTTSAAALAVASLLAPAAHAAPGDLDPSFGNTGRADLGVAGELWSLDLEPGGEVLFSGANDYCYYYYNSCGPWDFTGKLSPDGARDTDFVPAFDDAFVVYDTALQSDGKVIATGGAPSGSGASQTMKQQVTRLLSNGSLDTSFGDGGRVTISDGTTTAEGGRSVATDEQGRIVVAGLRGGNLVVTRLLASGATDPSFGTNGSYASSTLVDDQEATVVVSVPGGGYRVLVHEPSSRMLGRCTVHALTETGAPDASFGTAGVMTTPINLLPPESTQCSSIARQSDGRLLLGGVTRRADTEFTPGASQKSFAVRLMADGSQDTTFVPDLAGLSAVTALAVSSTGNVYAGGRDRSGQPGGVVLRLFAEGPLDPSFGRDGAAIVEPQTSVPGPADIRNIKVLANDALLVGGDGATACCAPRPFVARLLGDGAIGGPGVLGMTLGAMQAVQEGGQATLTVRRTGGSNGAISVGYATRGFGPSSEIAAPGDDYTLGAGRLSWGDGDTGERQIVIPISTDEFTEVPERFEVFLEAPEGGAGIGATASRVEIAGAGYPAGMFDVVADRTSAFEGAQVMFLVSRRYYSQGAVSVTLHIAASSSATPGDDFTNQGSTGAWTDVVLQWGDGDVSTKQVPVLLRRDDRGESAETLSVQLVSPAGGAAVGPAGETSVTIRDAVVPDQNSSRSGGGGGFGALGALMLGLTAALRRRGVRGR